MQLSDQRAVRVYYAFQFFFSLLIWLPVFYEYQRAVGLSDAQIFGIQSIYYVVFCLLEIPTGMLADRLGYRRAMRAGAWVLVASNLMPIVMQSYAGMLTHFLLIALSRSLISGASSAYLYEYLKGSGTASTAYKEAEGRARAYGLAGKVVFWAGVGALMQWKLTAPYWMTVVSSLVSVWFAHRLAPLREGDGGRAVAASNAGKGFAFLAELKPVVRMLRGQPLLLLVMFQGIAIFVLGRIVQVNLFQPILKLKDFSLESHGAVMSLMTVFEAAGSLLPGTSFYRRLVGGAWGAGWRAFHDLNAVFFLTLGMALAMQWLHFAGIAGTLASLALFSFVMGLSFPIQKQLMNDVIPDSRYRATLLSVESILDRAVNAWVALQVGVFVARGEVLGFLSISSTTCVVVMALLFLAIRAFRPARSSMGVRL